MTEIEALERDIEAARARLDHTIDAIQDRLTVSGIADDLLGSVRTTEFGSVIDSALAVVKRNPIPVMLVAAGVGWLVHRMSKDNGWRYAANRLGDEADDVPVLNTGTARLYDPDTSPRHPTQDSLETRRDINARV
jgi:Protein of unknown function (DUF3618)